MQSVILLIKKIWCYFNISDFHSYMTDWVYKYSKHEEEKSPHTTTSGGGVRYGWTTNKKSSVVYVSGGGVVLWSGNVKEQSTYVSCQSSGYGNCVWLSCSCLSYILGASWNTVHTSYTYQARQGMAWRRWIQVSWIINTRPKCRRVDNRDEVYRRWIIMIMNDITNNLGPHISFWFFLYWTVSVVNKIK